VVSCKSLFISIQDSNTLDTSLENFLADQELKHYWTGGRPYGCQLKLITVASRLDPYGRLRSRHKL